MSDTTIILSLFLSLYKPLNSENFLMSTPPEEVPLVFIGNLSPATTESDLIDIFSAYGKISSCKIPIDFHTHQTKYVAFLQYEDAASVQTAVNLAHGVPLHGRPLRVTVAKSRGERRDSQALRRECESMERPEYIERPAADASIQSGRSLDPQRPFRYPPEYDRIPFRPPVQVRPDFDNRSPRGSHWSREATQPAPNRGGLEEAIRTELERRDAIAAVQQQSNEALMELLRQIRRG
jgi:RNA recognition motif-containing protein